MTQTINKINSVKVSSNLPTFNTYRLMFKCGAWNTRATFICESDAEAIHDADEFFSNSNIKNWSYGVALFQGNRLVKQYR